MVKAAISNQSSNNEIDRGNINYHMQVTLITSRNYEEQSPELLAEYWQGEAVSLLVRMGRS